SLLKELVMTAFRKILVPSDFSPAAAEAFRVAVTLAKATGGEVIVAHVARTPAVVVENGQFAAGDARTKPHNLWDDFRPAATDDTAVRVTHEVVVAGSLSSARVLELLEKYGCDLIVIGSHGHGRLRRFFRGSVADDVVRNARCPVLVVK